MLTEEIDKFDVCQTSSIDLGFLGNQEPITSVVTAIIEVSINKLVHLKCPLFCLKLNTVMLCP